MDNHKRNHRTRNLLRIGAPVLVLGLGALAVAVLKATAPEPAVEENVARPVTVYTHLTERSDTMLKVRAQGEVRARTMIDLTSEVSGRVTAVSKEYVEGGHFEAGAVLLEIDDSDYRLALREAEAAVAAADLAVQQALADAEVARQQLRDVPNASDLSLKKPQIAEARAQREAALARVEQARLNLARTRISLPFEGRISSTTVHIGQVVSIGSSLGQVFSTDSVEVRLSLNDQQLAALGLPIGYSATDSTTAPAVRFSAEVAGRAQSWTGRLRHLDASIDPRTRLLYATAELQDPYASGRSPQGMPMAVGLFVDAEIEGRVLENVVQIPSEGLRPGGLLYVVDASGLLDVRQAEVADATAAGVIISEGLRPGERVVVSALRNARAGMRVSTIDALGYALAGQ
ncbi:MAG: efflux RND transporter periplasmic adaptor subunit [Pseudomonadota bacterium]